MKTRGDKPDQTRVTVFLPRELAAWAHYVGVLDGLNLSAVVAAALEAAKKRDRRAVKLRR